MSKQITTAGVLFMGEMGAAFGAMLASRGVRVLTTLRGRSDATAARCRAIRCEALDSVQDVIEQSDVVISLVPPDAAEDVAELYCAMANHAPANAVYVDLNSIAPESVAAIETRMTAVQRDFVDGAINGLAKNLTTSGTLFLSGPRSSQIADSIGDAMRVRVLGEKAGRASAMKMLLSGLSKGVCALFAEAAIAAQRQGMLSEMIDAYTLIYPGIMQLVDRMFPTYAQHAERRAAEVRELEATIRATGVDPCTIAGARELHEQLASIEFDAKKHDVKSLIEFLVGEGFLEGSKFFQTRR